MSASRIPTFVPRRESATARLSATVLFPTPPFPAPTRMMFFHAGEAHRAQSGVDVLADRRLERARGRRQLHLERHGVAFDAEVLHHPEAHQVAVQLRILDVLQGVEGSLGVEGHGTIVYSWRPGAIQPLAANCYSSASTLHAPSSSESRALLPSATRRDAAGPLTASRAPAAKRARPPSPPSP